MKKFNYRIFMKNNSGDFYNLTNDRDIVEMYRMIEKGKIIFGQIGNGHKVYINSNNIEMIEEVKEA